MQKPTPAEYATGYQKYFDLVPDGEYLSLLRQNLADTVGLFESVPAEKADYRYATGKWTIKEVLQHIIDTERVFSYRGLAAARGDSATPHYRMDEELYASNVDVSQRSLASLIAEFKTVRSSSEQLFENLSDAQTTRLCNIVTHPMTARAIGYFIIGHAMHHTNVVRERYLHTTLSTGRSLMKVVPVILDGQHVRLEPLTAAREDALVAAAADGELWNSTVTIVPSSEGMAAYIAAALEQQARGSELPFVIIRKATGAVVGTTRFYFIDPENRHVEIGYTWISASAQRTGVNTEAKLLLLTHAFETWRCIRVAFITDVLNERSRAAILRLGAKEEGILRSHLIMPGGRVRDSVCFSIIEAEWPEVKTRLGEFLSAKAS